MERRILGRPVRVAPLDYLLFLKLISDRPKDLDDADKLLRHHRGKVNLDWLRRELASLAESTAQPELARKLQLLPSEE